MELVCGTYRLHGQSLKDALAFAQKHGIRKIDSANTYRNVEDLKRFVAELDHDDWQLGGKVGLYKGPERDSLDGQLDHWMAEAAPLTVTRMLLHRNRDFKDWVAFAQGCLRNGIRSFGLCNVDESTIDHLMSELRAGDLLHLKPTLVQLEIHPHVCFVPVIEACRRHGILVEAHSLFRGGSPDPSRVHLFASMCRAVHGEPQATPVLRRLTVHQLLISWMAHHHRVSSLALRSTQEEHWNQAVEMVNLNPAEIALLVRYHQALDQFSSHFGRAPGSRIYKLHSQQQQQQRQHQQFLRRGADALSRLPASPKEAAVQLWAELQQWDKERARPDLLSEELLPVSQLVGYLSQLVPPSNPKERDYVLQVSRGLLNDNELAEVLKCAKKVDENEGKIRIESSLISRLASKLKILRCKSAVVRHQRRQRAKGMHLCCVVSRNNKKDSPPDPLSSDAIVHPRPMPVTDAPQEEVDIYVRLLGSGGNPDTQGLLPYPASDHPGLETPHGTLFFLDGRSDFCKQSGSPHHFMQVAQAVCAGYRVPLPTEEQIQQWMAEGKPPVRNGRVRHFLIGNNVSLGGGKVEPLLLMLQDPLVELETVYVAGNELDSQGLQRLCDQGLIDVNAPEKGTPHPHVKALWLKRNPLSAASDRGPETPDTAGLRRLGEVVGMSTPQRGLRVLDLQNCGLMHEGLLEFVEGLESQCSSAEAEHPTCGLRHLYLDANGLGEKCVPWLVRMVKLMPHLKTLYLGQNGLTLDGVLMLATGLQDHPRLRTLCLSSNAIRAESAAELVTFAAFLKALSLIPQLKSLDLGCYKSTKDLKCLPNFIGDGAIPLIQSWLATQALGLEHLSLRRNSLTDEGYLPLLQLLSWTERSNRRLSVEGRQALWQLKLNALSHSKEELRRLRHTRRVVHIDSIYRTRLKLDRV